MPDDDPARKPNHPQFAGFLTPGILQALDPGFVLEPYVSDPAENVVKEAESAEDRRKADVRQAG